TDPVSGATCEVEVSVHIGIATIARPVPAVAEFLGVRGRVVVIALERGGPGGVNDLTDGLVGIAHPTVLVEDRRRAGDERVRIDDPHAVLGRHPQTPRWSMLDHP